MIKLYNYLSRQRRAYFFFSLNFVSQRMRKEKKISRIRLFKNWAPWKENRVLRGASKLLVLVFIFSRARDPRTKFFSVLLRGTCVDSCPLCLSLPPPSISESHTLAITLRTCFTGEKTVFLRFSRGRGSRWRTAPACGLPRDISRNCLRGSGTVSRSATRQRKYSPLEIYSKIDLLLAAFFLSREKLFALSN